MLLSGEGQIFSAGADLSGWEADNLTPAEGGGGLHPG